MADVVFTLDAEEAKAWRGIMRLVDAQEKSERQFKKMGQEARRAGRATEDGMMAAGRTARDFAGQIVGITSAIGGVLAVAGILRKEWENLKQVQQAAAQASVSVAQARGGAIVNLPPGFAPEALDRFVQQSAVQTGMTEAQLYRMAQTGLSAKGGVSQEAFFDAMRTSAMVSARTGLDPNVLAGGALDLAKITGLESAQANIGWMRQVGSQARITDLSLQMKNLLPAIQMATQFGETPETAAEWATLMTGFIQDPTGEKARTGLINLSERLAKRRVVPGAGGGGPFGGGKAEWEMIPEEYTTLEQRMQYLSGIYQGADRKRQGEMLEKLGGEGPMRGFTAAALAGDPQVWEQLKRVQGAIGAPGAESAAGYRGMMAAIEGAPQEQVAAMKRVMAAGAEQISAADTAGAMGAVTREGMEKILQRSGMGWMERRMVMAGWEATTGAGTQAAPDEMLRTLESRRARMAAETVPGERYPTAGGMVGPVGPSLPGAEQYMVPNPAYDPEGARILGNILAELQAMNAKLEAGAPARNAAIQD